MVEKIKQCLAEEEERRKKGIVRGFSRALEEASILQSTAPKKIFDFSTIAETAHTTMSRTREIEEVPCNINSSSENIVEIVPESMDEVGEESEVDSDLERGQRTC